MKHLDWNLLSSFLAVANMGSLSKAAAYLGSTQPTIGRHIEQLELQLDVRLFDRTQQGYKITELGLQLAEQVRNMNKIANNIALTAAGKTQQVAGNVRITASEMIAINHLPQAIAIIRKQHPDINFEIIANNQSDNLLEREADIAIRMYRPVQDDLITRKVNDLELGIFVARSYPKFNQAMALNPNHMEAIFKLDLIGQDRQNLIINGFKQAGIKHNGKDINRDNFAIKSDSHEVVWKSLLNGLGISFQTLKACENHPSLVRILPEIKLDSLPIWLVAHKEVKTSRRIRLVYDAFCDYFAKI